MAFKDIFLSLSAFRYMHLYHSIHDMEGITPRCWHCLLSVSAERTGFLILQCQEIEMGLEDKMERTSRGKISERVFFTLGQSAPTQVLQVAARASTLLPHSLCPQSPLFLGKMFSAWRHHYFLFQKNPRKFTANILNENSLQKLTRVTKAVLFWLLWICYTWRHCTNSGWGSFVSHLWFTVGTNVMGTLNQKAECFEDQGCKCWCLRRAAPHKGHFKIFTKRILFCQAEQ